MATPGIYLRSMPSLGILYGSFTGLQALHPSKLLHELHQLHLRWEYLFVGDFLDTSNFMIHNFLAVGNTRAKVCSQGKARIEGCLWATFGIVPESSLLCAQG